MSNNTINNLKVSNNKVYELSKLNTKLVLNTCGHIFVGLAVTSLSLSTKSAIISTLGALVLAKTIIHGINTNKQISEEKKLIK